MVYLICAVLWIISAVAWGYSARLWKKSGNKGLMFASAGMSALTLIVSGMYWFLYFS